MDSQTNDSMSGDDLQTTSQESGSWIDFLRRRWRRVLTVIAVVLLPWAIYAVYSVATAFPKRTVVAVSRPGGRHHDVMQRIAGRLNQYFERSRPNIVPRKTRGSLDNFHLVRYGEVDFALYQAGTSDLLLDKEFTGLNEWNPETWDYDTESDGRLTLDEFIWQRTATVPADDPKSHRTHTRQDRELAKKAFENLDANQDGILSRDEFSNRSNIRFVANVYMEVLHIVVRKSDKRVDSIHDLRAREIPTMFGWSYSGHEAMSLAVLDHLGLNTKDFNALNLSEDNVDPLDLKGIFAGKQNENKTDAAFITIGLHSDAMHELLRDGEYKLIPVTKPDALAAKSLRIRKYTIPSGYYRTGPTQEECVPSVDIETVAVPAQLLAHKAVDPRIVEQVTRTVLSVDFQREANMHDMFAMATDDRFKFAQANTEFPIHPGASRVYDPQGIDASEVANWEAIYSLCASLVIALFLLGRWWWRRHVIRRGHRLDQYIRKLFDIEQKQLALNPSAPEYPKRLQAALQGIAKLRKQALGDFNAHEINEDSAIHSFFEMCHYISISIGQKVSEYQFERFIELTTEHTEASGGVDSRRPRPE